MSIVAFPPPAAGGITQLTGDGTAGPGSGSQALTLANSGVAAGAYTNANVTFDAKGRATVAASGSSSGGSSLLELQATQTLVSNTTAETTIFTRSIPANTLGTTNALHLRLNGNWLNNTGANRTVTIRVKLGGTTMWGSTTANIGTAAPTIPWGIDCWLANRGVTNSQYLSGWATVGAAGTGTSTAGTGVWGDFGGATSKMFVDLAGTAAEDTTGALTFLVTAQLSTNLTTLQISKELAILELLAP